MEFIVRPGQWLIDGSESDAPIWLDCRLGEGSFEFVMGDRRCPIPTLRTGVDEDGPFAVIAEQVKEFGHRWSMRVEPEFCEDLPGRVGCQILVSRAVDRRPIEAAVRAHGLRTGDVNLVISNEDGVFVYFDARGRYDGCGYTRRDWGSR